MKAYLDASVLVAFFILDPFTARAKRYLYSELPQAIVSDFAATEFSSAIARRVRTQRVYRDEARAAFSTFDDWITRAVERASTEQADFATAIAFMRRLDLNIRTGDALNLAISQRLGAMLVTFDERMAENERARRIGRRCLIRISRRPPWSRRSSPAGAERRQGPR